MTSRLRRLWQLWLASDVGGEGRQAVIVVCVYVASYAALDWISLVQVLPGVGFTLWNPPPAASLALLVLKGLRFAPALFVAGAISDGLVGGFLLGIQPTLASDLIIAIGYTGIAAALRHFADAGQGFPRVADVVWLLLIVGAGTFAVACFAVAVLMMMHALPPDTSCLAGTGKPPKSRLCARKYSRSWRAPAARDLPLAHARVVGQGARILHLAVAY
jgi:hypothetical protein